METTTTTTPPTVGWNDILTQPSTGSGVDPSSMIERTRNLKFDANDYSRFKDIGKDKPDDKPAPTAPLVGDKCRNCHKPGAKLKCSVCKKAAYCARACQASDWKFHKRTCKKPEDPKKDAGPPRRPPTTESPSKPVSTSSSSSSKTTSAAKKTSSGESKVVVKDTELDGQVRGYKNGLPYFHRELSEEEQNLIGDIAPKRVDAPPAPATSNNEGSAWNAAGTFEERNYTKWAKDKLNDLYNGTTFGDGKFLGKFKTPESYSGDASVCFVRGTKRFLFDFNFKLPFEVSVDGGETYKGSFQMNDISNDQDFEISFSLKKKPKSASENEELTSFISDNLKEQAVFIISTFMQEFQSL
ncbi:TPA: hypothetical protein N0F65_001318 [Lagenidium giganteum]|uniref:MYND-type domain-containing protein n=1 Tax=Lagenidium giganteum TaxID=4803 RepID=A0AAV2Z520_9STRA|nr:TPA: hypothetical protein N0F65_001318 [Lagenidium giganteum]